MFIRIEAQRLKQHDNTKCLKLVPLVITTTNIMCCIFDGPGLWSLVDNIDIIDINTALKHSTWHFIITDKYTGHGALIRPQILIVSQIESKRLQRFLLLSNLS